MVDPICMGFLFAIPVIWVRSYTVRLLSSVGLPLFVYLWLWVAMNPHPGWPMRVDVLLFMFGGLCAAHVRSAWEAVCSRLQTR